MHRLLKMLKIARRNIFRNRRRSLLTIGILVLGNCGFILIGGFFDSLMDGFREQWIHSQSGHLQINLKGYYEKGSSAPYDYLIQNTQELREKVEAIPHVLFTVPRLKIGGLANSEKTSVSVMALGTDSAEDRRMGKTKAANSNLASVHILQGEDLDGNDPYGAVLGKGLAASLGLKVGDTFNFITTRETGSLEGSEFKVRGIFETIAKDFDDRGMKVNLKTFQEVLNLDSQIHSLLVVLDETKNTSEVQKNLQEKLSLKGQSLEIIDWRTLGLFYRQTRDLFDKIYFTIQIIIVTIFFFSISNSINMALYERIREFGTMMAIGNSRGFIFGNILLEALFLGILGSAVGVLVAVGLSELISSSGIPMPPPPNGTTPFLAQILLSWRLVGESFFISLLSTLVSALVPAYRASHFEITHALGYV